jgi:hypothetical protein
LRRALLALVLVGCANNLCDGIDGACIDLTVTGTGEIDTLRLRFTGAVDTTKIAPPFATVSRLPVNLAIALTSRGPQPIGAKIFSGGPLEINVTALRHDIAVGVGLVDLSLTTTQHVSATVSLKPPGATPPMDLAFTDFPSFDLARPLDLKPACVDTTKDPMNCGECGHDCLGGTCSASQCQPIAITTNPNRNQFPTGIAVDANAVYWLTTGTQGGLWKQPLTGGAPSQIWFDSSKLFGQMTLSNGALYFVVTNAGVQNGIWTVPTFGGTPTLALADPQADAVALDASHLYWGRSASILSSTTGADFGTFVTLGSCGFVCQSFATDGTTLYFVSSSQIQKMNLPSGSPMSLATLTNVAAIALDDKHVYAATGSTIVAIDRGSGTQLVLATIANGGARGVAVDARAIYFSNSNDGSISRLAKPPGF